MDTAEAGSGQVGEGETRRMTALRRYARAYEDLRPDTIGALCALVVPDVHFRDPFSDFRGRDRLAGVFRHMFQGLGDPRFTVEDMALGREVGFLRWTFTFTFRGRPHRIEGMSEVRFDDTGRVVAHLDHWDASVQVYMKVPVLGRVISLIRRRLAG